MATAALSLLVPPVLARHLPQAEFSSWMLILQLATYTSLLNLGIQSATSRYVAYYFARNDRDSASEIVSTAFATLALAALAAFGFVLLISENISGLFPTLPVSLIASSRTSLLLMGFTLALGLPLEAIVGTFTGIQRSELVTVIQGGSRLVLTFALISIASMRGGMTSMAAVFSLVNLIGYFIYWWTSRHLDVVDISFRRVRRRSFGQIWEFCGTLIIWSVAMFFINGFDVAIVGRLDFAAVGVYSMCFTPILMIAGAQQALFSPLLQFAAALPPQSAKRELPLLLLRSTKVSTLFLLSLSIPLLLFSRFLLGWWLGPKFTEQASNIFTLLLIGNTIRLLALPYAFLLLATLKHKQVVLAPVVEAVSNVVVAIAAGLRYGAIGVAYGVVAGAFIGQLMIIYISAPQTMDVVGNLKKLLWRGIAQPFACALPALLVAVTNLDRLSQSARWLVYVPAALVCGALAWRFSLDADEKLLVLLTLSKVSRLIVKEP